jgi:hypothetical protein
MSANICLDTALPSIEFLFVLEFVFGEGDIR